MKVTKRIPVELKISNLQKAIAGQQRDLNQAIIDGRQSAIDAQQSYLNHLQKLLVELL